MTFRQRPWLMVVPVLLLAAGSAVLHRRLLGHHVPPAAGIAWFGVIAISIAQCVLSWLSKPFTGTPPAAAVAVVVPCYNEDPALLARVLESLRWQTRPPDQVIVTDDGSAVSYADVIAAYPEVTWLRTVNRGKKHAQAAAFAEAPGADIFVTIDSDSALEKRAIEEGLKPFADERVIAAAGIEMASNWDRNMLTRAIAARSLAFQLFAMSSQSAARGSVLICPGAFSLYRASLIREILPAYLGETFCGVPVTLGDDTALTFFALMRGRVVQQPTAFSFPAYPESVSHHLRQWTRWMRASTIRQIWRLRYLPMTSYGWWFSVWQLTAFTAGVAATFFVAASWPASESLAIGGLGGLFAWPLVLGCRLFTIRRSDQTIWGLLCGVALMPLAALWYLLVLRQIRFYGIATCTRQHWVTREHVEVRLEPAL
ncbi:MAG: glycosyltransferase family 2 protein [Actinomycetota bacterium]